MATWRPLSEDVQLGLGVHLNYQIRLPKWIPHVTDNMLCAHPVPCSPMTILRLAFPSRGSFPWKAEWGALPSAVSKGSVQLEKLLKWEKNQHTPSTNSPGWSIMLIKQAKFSENISKCRSRIFFCQTTFKIKNSKASRGKLWVGLLWFFRDKQRVHSKKPHLSCGLKNPPVIQMTFFCFLSPLYMPEDVRLNYCSRQDGGRCHL